MIDSENDMRWREIPDQAVESWWQSKDGWDIRRIDFPAADTNGKKGALLFIPGRGDHYEKYLETLDYWSTQGWHVTSIDWRGQGLSGRLTSNPRLGHIDDFSTWISDLKFFWDKWVQENNGPHVVVAHSMGGHLTMRALAEKAIAPQAVVLSAPMLGIRSNGLPLSWTHTVIKWIVGWGRGNKPAWKESEKPMSRMSLRRQILTHSRRRYDDEMSWWEKRPDVRLGPPSWHWLERAVASTRLLHQPGMLERVDIPVLLLATKADQLVSTKQILKDHKRLPISELELFGAEAAHELLREVDQVRDRCLEAADKFFAKHAVAEHISAK